MKHTFPIFSVIFLLMAATVQSAQQSPITLYEVSFMRRAGFSEADILKDVKARKLRSPLAPKDETELRGLGLSPAFIAALKLNENNLPRETVEHLDARQKLFDEYRVQMFQREVLARAAASEADDETKLTRKRLALDKLEDIVEQQQRIIENQEARIFRLEAVIQTLSK